MHSGHCVAAWSCPFGGVLLAMGIKFTESFLSTLEFFFEFFEFFPLYFGMRCCFGMCKGVLWSGQILRVV